MEIKLMFLVLFSLLLFTNGVKLNGHQMLSAHDLAHGFSFHAMPRKLMLNVNPKVEGFENLSATSSSKATMQEGSDPSRLFTMDYTPMRKKRPVHNK